MARIDTRRALAREAAVLGRVNQWINRDGVRAEIGEVVLHAICVTTVVVSEIPIIYTATSVSVQNIVESGAENLAPQNSNRVSAVIGGDVVHNLCVQRNGGSQHNAVGRISCGNAIEVMLSHIHWRSYYAKH
jgi:hypothetical protein